MDSQKDVDSHVSFPQNRQEFPTTDLSKAAAQSIAIHNRMAMLRDDQSKAGMRNGGGVEEDVQETCSLSLPPLEQPPDLGALSDP